MDQTIITPANTHAVLADLVAQLACKPGWTFALWAEEPETGVPVRLVITVGGSDAYRPERPLTVSHFFPVPTATYNRASWCRWLFEMCRRLENHELGEWFRVDGARPFAPLHGPGEDPYTVHEYRPERDARTLQDGAVTEIDITGAGKGGRL